MKEFAETELVEDFVRLANTHFNENDTWVTLTHSKQYELDSREQAEASLLQFMEQLKKQQPQESGELKYVAVTYFDKDKLKKINAYHQVIMNFADTRTLEYLWNGGRAIASDFANETFGNEAFMRYVLGGGNRSLITNISE